MPVTNPNNPGIPPFFSLPLISDMDPKDVARLQGMMMYNIMVFRSTYVPLTNEWFEINKVSMGLTPQAMLSDWAERQKSAFNFLGFIDTFGKQLFGSATYQGEKLLAENDLFQLSHIPVKKGVVRRASMFHVGGFVPYSDNLFRLLPEANFFDRFLEQGIDVYEMKCKCSSDRFNAHLLNLNVEAMIDTVHRFSDIAFEHCGNQPMILEGYCGTGIHTYSSYLADVEGMSRKFDLITTFVSPIDGRQCTIFEEMHKLLAYLNPSETNVDGLTISNVLDTVQERNFEKTPFGAMVHGWKNKEYANVEKMEDLSSRQRSELAAWYWLSLKHGSFYPLSHDLYAFYAQLFSHGVGENGELPGVYKGKKLCLKDLKKTKVNVVAFLGDRDNLVVPNTADILKKLLGKQCEIVIHEKTGHVAYIFNPQRWNPDDKRAFKPGIIEKIMEKRKAAK